VTILPARRDPADSSAEARLGGRMREKRRKKVRRRRLPRQGARRAPRKKIKPDANFRRPATVCRIYLGRFGPPSEDEARRLLHFRQSVEQKRIKLTARAVRPGQPVTKRKHRQSPTYKEIR
jgi:hypothetical protein